MKISDNIAERMMNLILLLNIFASSKNATLTEFTIEDKHLI